MSMAFEHFDFNFKFAFNNFIEKLTFDRCVLTIRSIRNRFFDSCKMQHKKEEHSFYLFANSAGARNIAVQRMDSCVMNSICATRFL